MSIVRVGLAETKKYGDGWEAIFGGGKPAKPARRTKPAAKKRPKVRKKSK